MSLKLVQSNPIWLSNSGGATWYQKETITLLIFVFNIFFILKYTIAP